ncbi:hypothetical protein FUT69_01775 [Xylella taiwanensis]|nr:hypothetical protein [Xylella taiwanensis]
MTARMECFNIACHMGDWGRDGLFASILLTYFACWAYCARHLKFSDGTTSSLVDLGAVPEPTDCLIPR